MSSPPKLVQKVQNVLRADATRKALVVEGPTDEAIYAKRLERLAAPDRFRTHVEIVNAEGAGGGGGKEQVLRCLRWFVEQGGEPRVFGLVDRDEWDQATFQARCLELPQLRLNPDRHAIESYFCDPQDIEPALLAIFPGANAAITALGQQVAAALPLYVDHWSLLTTTDRIKARMMEHGYPGYFSEIPTPPDADIQQRFRHWAQTLDPAAAFAEFDNLRTQARGENPNRQARVHVWAKTFFESVMQPALNGVSQPYARSGPDWMLDLAERAATVPGDIAAILVPLLA